MNNRKKWEAAERIQNRDETFQQESFPRGTLPRKWIFASHDNPKGNADAGRVIRTIKEDLVGPNEWKNHHEFQGAWKPWPHQHNTDFPHSALNYKGHSSSKKCGLKSISN